MVKLYVDLITKGLRTIDQVPAQWRDAVQAELDKRASESGND